jgi:hypothetical protein
VIEETGEAIDARARLVAWARGEIGTQNPDKYFRVCAPSFVGKGAEIAWCGIFCLAGLHALELCSWLWSTDPKEPGFVWRLDRTRDPLLADIAVFRFDEHRRELWHHAFIERFDGASVATIDGNVLRRPLEGVAARVHPVTSDVTFYSIAQLLRDGPRTKPT